MARQDYVSRVRELIGDAHPWPPREDVRQVAEEALVLADALRLLPDDKSVQLDVEVAVGALSQRLNPLGLPLSDAPLFLLYRGWSSSVMLHHKALHTALKTIVTHFGMEDLYKRLPVTGPHNLSVGKPPKRVVDGLESSARRIMDCLACAPESLTDHAATKVGARNRKGMTVEQANAKASELAKKMQREFVHLSENQQAALIGTTWRTWSKTRLYAQLRKRKEKEGLPARRRKGGGSPRTVSLTGKLEDVLVDKEESQQRALNQLIADQEADGEPSPLEEDPLSNRRKVYARKRT